MAITNARIPDHFFPDAAPKMRACFWQSLMVEKWTIRETLTAYLKDTIKTLDEQEIADLITVTLELDWNNYLAAERKRKSMLGAVQQTNCPTE